MLCYSDQTGSGITGYEPQHFALIEQVSVSSALIDRLCAILRVCSSPHDVIELPSKIPTDLPIEHDSE